METLKKTLVFVFGALVVLGVIWTLSVYALLSFETILNINLRTADGFSVQIRSHMYFDDIVGTTTLALAKNGIELVGHKNIGSFVTDDISKERRRRFELLDTRRRTGFVVYERLTDSSKGGQPILFVQRDPLVLEFDTMNMAQSKVFAEIMLENGVK